MYFHLLSPCGHPFQKNFVIFGAHDWLLPRNRHLFILFKGPSKPGFRRFLFIASNLRFIFLRYPAHCVSAWMKEKNCSRMVIRSDLLVSFSRRFIPRKCRFYIWACDKIVIALRIVSCVFFLFFSPSLGWPLYKLMINNSHSGQVD